MNGLLSRMKDIMASLSGSSQAERLSLITELVLAMTKGATVAEVAATCHAHPAMGEAVKEACLDAMGRAIHA